MRAPDHGLAIQPVLDDLIALLDAAVQRSSPLPALPQGVHPITARDVARWACDGFDVQPLLRHAERSPLRADAPHWGYAYARRLARRWAELLHDVPHTTLADRWAGAIAALGEDHRTYATVRLTDEVRKALQPPLVSAPPMPQEEDELATVMRHGSRPRSSGVRPS